MILAEDLPRNFHRTTVERLGIVMFALERWRSGIAAKEKRQDIQML